MAAATWARRYGGISCVMFLIALVLCFVPSHHVLTEYSSGMEGVCVGTPEWVDGPRCLCCGVGYAPCARALELYVHVPVYVV